MILIGREQQVVRGDVDFTEDDREVLELTSFYADEMKKEREGDTSIEEQFMEDYGEEYERQQEEERQLIESRRERERTARLERTETIEQDTGMLKQVVGIDLPDGMTMMEVMLEIKTINGLKNAVRRKGEYEEALRRFYRVMEEEGIDHVKVLVGLGIIRYTSPRTHDRVVEVLERRFSVEREYQEKERKERKKLSKKLGRTVRKLDKSVSYEIGDTDLYYISEVIREHLYKGRP